MSHASSHALLLPLSSGDEASSGQTLRELQSHLGDHPQDAITWFQLGVSLHAQRRFEEAAAALYGSLTLSPHNAGVECAYALALAGTGALNQAGELLEDVISRHPGEGWAYFHLASVRFRQGDCAAAAEFWKCSSRLLQDPLDSLENLALTLKRLGDVKGEIRCWETILANDPSHPAASHMLRALGCGDTPQKPDRRYISRLFDRFAPEFDRVLTQLEYSVPDFTPRWMQSTFGEPAKQLRVLDAGCGTGLCGQHLRPWAGDLAGVDLSSQMLEHARLRAIYDTLEHADLVEFMLGTPNRFDLVFAGDVLCYFGDLAEVIAAACAALRPGGSLAFSVETTEECPLGYTLQSHGRYAHAPRYVAQEVARLGSQVCEPEFLEIVVRTELAQPVQGLWVSVRRQ